MFTYRAFSSSPLRGACLPRPVTTNVWLSLLQVLEMPNCYFVNDYRQSETAVIDDPAPNRSDYGLPPQRVVFPANRDHSVGDALRAIRLHSGGQRDHRDLPPTQEGGKDEQEASGGGRSR